MDRIKEASYQLIYHYNTRCPYELAASLGIEIIEYNFKTIRGVALTKEGRKYIGVKRDLPEQEKRAVIAHEIGHLEVHPGSGYFYIHENIGFVLGKQEREAEMFAAALLLDEPPEPGESVKAYAMRKGVPRKLVETYYKLR
jgi:Zn-dependent peptidase ImmA (M78 family)